MKEYIICAAIHYKDGKVYEAQPANIESGIVIAGRRHQNCILTIAQLLPDYDKTLIGREGQGFITASNRYVDRVEAYQIAKRAGQLLMNIDDTVGSEDKPQLISENLY